MSAHIGYAAMLERFPPAEAVALAALAEQHGFTGVMATDHFQPWTPRLGGRELLEHGGVSDVH